MSDDPPYPMERYQESIRENCLFIAFVENQTVGYLNYFPHYGFGMNEELRKVASIEELYLDAPYRNRGIGQQILREIFEYARQQQCEEISLSVDAANTAAFSLYQKLGFSIRSYGMKLKL